MRLIDKDSADHELLDASKEDLISLIKELKVFEKQNIERIRNEAYEDGYDQGTHEYCSECEEKDEEIRGLRKELLSIPKSP